MLKGHEEKFKQNGVVQKAVRGKCDQLFAVLVK